MNTRKIVGFATALLAAVLIFTGCSDQFLQDKKDYTKVTDPYSNYATAEAAINGIYALALSNSTASFGWRFSSAGSSDIYSQSTEEYSGLSALVDQDVTITTSGDGSLPNVFYNERKTSTNLYGFIFSCNDAIESIPASTGLTQEEKDKLIGQAYFFRAWVYYRLVKEYGGVPIVTKVQNPISGEVDALTIPRSTTKACIDFICEDLQTASTLLPSSWSGNNYGRVTAGAALALQGRTRLLYASPVFNRADNKDRWEAAYQSNKNAIAELKAAGFGLAYADAPGVNASGWGKMFSDFSSTEAVFVTLYNNVNKGTNTTPELWNGWEKAIRPTNANGGGGKNTTDLMIDLFPMADGKKPGQSSFTYNKNLFMINRDPRFYRTFAFPGVYWRFSGDPTTNPPSSAYPYKGSDYALWNYAWYDTADKRTAMDQSGYSGDGLAENYKGVYIRKRTDDLDINATPLYVYKVDKGNGFEQSASPYMEIRYAEVLLNFAEAACGAGYYSEALEALRDIRKRVGYTGECGLDNALAGDRGGLFAAILYERQIELAYEGKRFDDMRRWMLWDGGVGQASIQPTWALTGFNANTCTYLGVKPFNGNRRGLVELCVTVKNGVVGNATATDPYNATRPAAWNLATQTLSDRADLVKFYTDSLTRKDRIGDDLTKTVSFQPQYYFIGLKSNAQTNNPTLEQTVGWADIIKGGTGTFDPLAE
ncbi:RagB/SusD family nutrient uptake outer membrane protein [Dysgonomonas alginatilytica]|nr:RagB/SusD family nutrient uptake outer membrane protein [Dysgonomonas alginatilytica]